MNPYADIELPEDKPKTVDDYVDAVEDRMRIDLKAIGHTRYEEITQEAQRAIENSQFWTSLCKAYSTLADRYKADEHYDLFGTPTPPAIIIKSYKSLLDKSYRKNVLNNIKYPAMPVDGWLLPPDWFSKTNDIIRTSIAVKYLDGVDFLVANLEYFGAKLRLQFSMRF